VVKLFYPRSLFKCACERVTAWLVKWGYSISSNDGYSVKMLY